MDARITWELWGAAVAVIGTHIATTALLIMVVRWSRDDQERIETRMDAGFAEFRTEMKEFHRENMEFRAEMKEFHREHAEMNKRIIDLQLDRRG